MFGSADSQKLASAKNGREKYFQRMQKAYDMAKKINDALKADAQPTYVDNAELFLARMGSVDSVLASFERMNADIDTLNEKVDPLERVDTLKAAADFDELYYFSKCVERKVYMLPEYQFVDTRPLRGLDPSTRKAFELKHSDVEIPAFSDLISYVEQLCKIQELTKGITSSGKSSVKSNSASSKPSSSSSKPQSSLLNSLGSSKCVVCAKECHKIRECPKFKEITPVERYELMKRLNRCRNCLGNHYTSLCKSSSRCSKCTLRHHSDLHFGTDSKPSQAIVEASGSHIVSNSATSINNNSSDALTCNVPQISNFTIMLGTAVVSMLDIHGQPKPVRILIDIGSQVCLMTKKCSEALGLRVQKSSRSMTAVGGTPIRHSNGMVSCIITPSQNSEPRLETQAFVINKITGDQPQVHVDHTVRNRFNNLCLADPKFDQPGEIDFLMGAELYPLILNATHNFIIGEPSAISTIFGWILVGKAPVTSSASLSLLLSPSYTVNHCSDALDISLKKFWEIEEISTHHPPNPEDDACEALFQESHYRQPCGRFVVRLPFKNTFSTLPNNREVALKRFLSLESRLSRQTTARDEYIKFMEEYKSLGHMSLAHDSSSYIIPHHIVLKHDSVTTKLRVVFDASASCGPDNISLNSSLLNGPKLQKDIWQIISSFRLFPIVLCADLRMMYRQILVDPRDRTFQRIFYRSSPTSDVEEYLLNTVTYGVGPSAYLALRCLIQLVKDDGAAYPLASKAILEQTFVDDITAGAHDLESALCLQRELNSLLALGGFTLHKWSSNHPALLESVSSDKVTLPLNFSVDDDRTLKILGIKYDPRCDTFSYSIAPNNIRITKRGVLSEIAKIYDPLGWLTPVTFFAKHIMQLIWMKGLQWDDLLPPDLTCEWNNFTCGLPALSAISIPRYIPAETSDAVHVLGYCDASEKGYACVVYAVTIRPDHHSIHIIQAKSKIAPLKTISLPRLELSGALLLSKLIGELKPYIESLHAVSINLFTDSTIALSWIRTPPYKLKTYVANRVAEILNTTNPSQWHHVKSEHNPADPASRGLLGPDLVQCHLWWKGPPDFLVKEHIHFSSSPEIQESVEYLHEFKPHASHLTTSSSVPYLISILEKYSNYHKALRIFSYVLRFIHNRLCQRADRYIGSLSPSELKQGFLLMIRVSQYHHFSSDIKLLKKGESVSNKLRSLTPFLDENGLIRVRGRIENSNASYDLRHPYLIPHEAHIAKLMCDHFHRLTLHGGHRLISSLLQRRFWIPALRRLIRSRIFRCSTCYLPKAPGVTPLMGDLPASRFSTVRAFRSVALDYAGFFTIRESLRRNAPRSKGYLVVIVCLSTKAVHLDFAPDLSTPAFLRALDRFVARRGLCNEIFSDNGTNLVGASRHLKEVFELLASSQDVINDHLASQAIAWNFSPPAGPHFNGISEAAVKTAKHHITRVIGKQIMTFEEMTTVVCRIEAVLNSRPLGSFSADAHEDSDFLTPGHFIVGAPLLAPPEEDIHDVAINRLNRHQLIRHSVQNFWRRWKREYLPTLIPRSKWTELQENLSIGDVVYLRNVQTPPLQWPIGRILAIYPGKDGIVRVAKIRTTQGEYVRPVHNLIPLPPAN
uniref:Integrase catalytic domain-containing protein n=2 Tax=Lygus hesperus TaxID=30085 RepID=A0A146L7F7_LYGHE